MPPTTSTFPEADAPPHSRFAAVAYIASRIATGSDWTMELRRREYAYAIAASAGHEHFAVVEQRPTGSSRGVFKGCGGSAEASGGASSRRSHADTQQAASGRWRSSPWK